MNSRRIPAFLLAAVAASSALPARAGTYTANVSEGQTLTIDAAFVAALGTDDLVKTGRGTLVSSADMSAYTGTITVREGAFKITTISDLGTAAGGTVVEDGGTLVVNMTAKDQRFSNEDFTIAGTGDAAYGAAIYQSDFHNNDQNKLFKNLTLSGDATIFAGTHLGLADRSLSMNGHTLTIGGSFTFRNITTTAPAGSLVVASGTVRFRGGSTNIGDASKTLTVQNGGRLILGVSGDNAPPIWWKLVVEEGGKVLAEESRGRTYYGDVEWNSTVADGSSGPLTFSGNVTGTGTIKASSATLTFAKPLGAGVGLAASGTASIELPKPKAYSYEHKGMKIVRRGTLTSDLTYYDETRGDVVCDYCAFGPGPQLDVSYWATSGKKGWCSRGYLWNRETTDVTYTIGINCVYQNYVFVNGIQVYYKKRDGESSGSTAISVPSGSCVAIDIVTTSDQLYGPRTEKGDGDKFKINGVVANDPTGWYFTTNAVSGVANPADLPSLLLADDGAIDMNGMPLSADVLSGAGLVTNVTTLTIADSWTLTAADVENGDTLVVDGDVVFGNGATISVSNLQSLPVAQPYTICKADSIAGIANGTLLTEHAKTWKVVLSGDGTTLSLENVPQGTVVCVR